MSDSGPPPESGQLMSTGDSVQADQSIKWDFLKQQTVTLTLNLNDILKNENQALLNDCEFSVSGRMAFGCKNCIDKESAVDQTSLVDSTPENVRVQDNNSAPQPPQHEQQEVCYSESQKVVNSINKSQVTLNEASDLLLKCSETLEKLKSELYASSESDDRSEKIKKVADSEVKQTTVEVIKMLEELGKDTGTVDSNNDDGDNPPSDDEDNDGPGKQSEDPKGQTNPPDDPSKRDEASTETHPTDSTEEHKESTESELAETTTTEIDVNASSQEEQSELTESVSASEMDKQETGEKQKQEENDTEQQQVKDELGGSSEEAVNAEAAPQQEDGSPQEPPTLEDLSLSESTADQKVQEEMKEKSPEDVEASPPVMSMKDDRKHGESSLPALEMDKKEKDSEETTDARSDPYQQAKLPQQSSAPAESVIEPKSDDNEAPLLAKKEVVEDEQQGGDECEIQKMEGELEEDFEEAFAAGFDPQHEAERPQESSTSTESVIEPKPDDNTTPLLDKDEFVKNEEQEEDESGKQAKEGEKSEEAPSTGSNPQNEAELSQDPPIPEVPVIEEPATSDKAGNDENVDNVVAQPNVGEQAQSAGNVQPIANEGPQLTQRQIRNKAKNKRNTEKKKTDQAIDDPVVDNNPVVEKENDRGDVSLDVMFFALFAEMNDIRKNRTGINDTKLPELLKGISLFHRKDFYKQHANVIPEVVFNNLLGDEWEEKEGTGSEICRKLAYFSTHETSKTSAQDMVAYLHHHHQKTPNPKQRSPKGKVISMDDLFSKFIKEICIWSDDHWVTRMLEYAKYQTEELSKQHKKFMWKKPPPMYNINRCVMDRLYYHKTNLEANKTFENQLIVDCYVYLLQEPRFIGFHNILNFDLDYICTRSKASIDNIEWKFFSTVFGFDATTLMIPEEVTDESEKPKTSSVPEESTSSSESRPGGKAKAAEPPCFPEISEHNFKIFFTLIVVILANSGSFEGQTTISPLLLEFCMFHESAHWEKYKTLTPDSVTLKLFGPKEEWENKNEPGHKLCRLLEKFYAQNVYRHSAHKMLAHLDHFVTEDSNTMKSKESLANQFASLIDAQVCEWLQKHREDRLNNYLQYLEKLRENSEVQSKYCWKPKPPSFKTSPRFKEILAFHHGNLEKFISRYCIECYEIMKNLDDKRSELLDEDLDYIFTRPAKMLLHTEREFFIVACHKPKLTNVKGMLHPIPIFG